MIGVFLAEDHETVREGLRLLVNAQDDMRVVGEAGDGQTAIEQAQALKPNVVVLDLSMPQVNGVVAAQTLKTSLPSAASRKPHNSLAISSIRPATTWGRRNWRRRRPMSLRVTARA